MTKVIAQYYACSCYMLNLVRKEQKIFWIDLEEANVVTSMMKMEIKTHLKDGKAFFKMWLERL